MIMIFDISNKRRTQSPSRNRKLESADYLSANQDTPNKEGVSNEEQHWLKINYDIKILE